MFVDALNILLIEDNLNDAELLQEILLNYMPRVTDTQKPVVTHVDRLGAGLSKLSKNDFSAILLDMTLPDSQGIETFNRVHRQAPTTPVVILSGQTDVGLALKTVQSGAQDYLVKGAVDGEAISRSVRYAIERNRLVIELEQRGLAVLAQEANLRRIIEKNVDAMLVIDSPGRVRFANPAAEKLFGKPTGELFNLTLNLPLENQCPYEWTITRSDGGVVPVEMCATRMEWQGSLAWLVSLRDITSRKEAESAVILTSKVFETALEGILITDENGKILRANRAFSAITGYEIEEVIGKNPRMLASGRHDRSFYEDMWKTLKTVSVWQGEIWNRRKNGEIYPEWLRISAVRGADGKVVNYVGMFNDITTHKEAEMRLQFLASHDALTGLPNRVLFHDRLEQALLRSRRTRKQVAILFLDLDGFKKINDTYGHQIGDKLLQVVSTRLKENLRSSDTVARPSGDEFTILLEDLNSPADALMIGYKVARGLSAPVKIDEQWITVKASLGFSLFPNDGTDGETLLRKADQAMYQAKKSNRGGVLRYREG